MIPEGCWDVARPHEMIQDKIRIQDKIMTQDGDTRQDERIMHDNYI